MSTHYRCLHIVVTPYLHRYKNYRKFVIFIGTTNINKEDNFCLQKIVTQRQNDTRR